MPAHLQNSERRKRIEDYLDVGHGDCWLKRHDIGSLVQNAFLHFDDTRYRLHAWVVMPNHVHVLLTPRQGHTVGGVVQSWKSFTSRRALEMLRRKAPFWQADYFDRQIRNEQHYAAALDYIEMNPVKAGLCNEPQEWPFSSTHWRVR
jgi:REP element-mobilizing transposase RayT